MPFVGHDITTLFPDNATLKMTGAVLVLPVMLLVRLMTKVWPAGRFVSHSWVNVWSPGKFGMSESVNVTGEVPPSLSKVMAYQLPS